MKIFYTVISCLVIALTIVTINIRRESTNFYGIAETKEMVINAEFGVEIKDMRVTPGQSVKTGDTLMEMRSPEIDLKISEYSHLINEMETRSKTQVNLSKSEIRQLKIQNEARFIEILSELQELQSQYEINRKLMKQLRSINTEEHGASDSNPTLIRIQNLKNELARINKQNAIIDENLHSQISFGVDPLQEMLKQYHDQLRLYNELKQKLFIIAPNDGVIGVIHYRKGEMVPAFDTIATLHSKSPSFILGYIHENIYSSVTLGQKVLVHSITDKKNVVQGEVIGVGTRIVEYPIRLRPVQEYLMWGREVTIKLPPDNNFLLGEKVLISLEDRPRRGLKKLLGFSGSTHAATRKDSTVSVSPTAIRNICWFNDIRPSIGIEASGVQYLPDIQKFCLISDESENLFLMDSNGVIHREIQIDGLGEISDMEGITAGDDGYIYIVCSQNPTKKGKLPDKRKRLIRLSRKGEVFSLSGEIKLIDALVKAATKADPKAGWTDLIKVDVVKRTPDIEGIAFKDNSLFLGFKAPLINDSSAILRINNARSIFEKSTINPADISLWKLLPLKDDSSGLIYQISDIQFDNDNLYILSNATISSNDIEVSSGRLWVLTKDNHLKVLENYHSLKPEGITFSNQSILITFDNGSDKLSQFTTLKRSL